MAKARNRYREDPRQDPLERARQRERDRAALRERSGRGAGLPAESKISVRLLEMAAAESFGSSEAMRRMAEAVERQMVSMFEIPPPRVVTDEIKPAEPAKREPPVHRTGKALGFRTWRLDGYNLKSAGWSHNDGTRLDHGGWALGPQRAECKKGMGHDAPDPDCGCGFYALHAPEPPGESSRWYAAEPDVLHGAVLGWGRMEVHREGWRAEWAEPVMLAYHPRQPYEHVERVKVIAGELGLPLVPWERYEEEARKLAEPVPEDLRPARRDRAGEIFMSFSTAPLLSGGVRGGSLPSWAAEVTWSSGGPMEAVCRRCGGSVASACLPVACPFCCLR